MKREINRGRKTYVHTVPAPVGGWNSRESVDAMDETDAVLLDNIFPGHAKVSGRKGSAAHATDLGDDVMMLAEFNAVTTRTFLAAANGEIWDITDAGAGESLADGFDSDSWEWAQFDDASGGARMAFVNGVDAPQVYDGATVGALTISGSGLTVESLDGINIYKGRSYFWCSDTQDFWYSAVSALGGACTKFPLGRVHGTGGNLQKMITWTRDGGDGVDDLAVFIMTSGDVLIYTGSNPGAADDWSLIGHFRIGAPLGMRCAAKAGGDVWIITVGGYVPLSGVLTAGEVETRSISISGKIRGAVSDVTNRYASNVGWQPILYPRHSLGASALFNVPVSATQYHQHVLNIETGAWCRYTGMNARCWGLFNNRLYFGGDGVVYLADTGTNDADMPILCRGQTAWNHLKKRGSLKQLTMLRIVGQSTGQMDYLIDVGADFGALIRQGAGQTVGLGGAAEWDTALWDVAKWAVEQNAFEVWHSVGEMGYTFSIRLEYVTSTRLFDWYSTAYGYQVGGIL